MSRRREERSPAGLRPALSLAVAASLLGAATLMGEPTRAQLPGGEVSREALSVDPEEWYDLFADQPDGTDLQGWRRARFPGGGKPDGPSPWAWDADRKVLTYTPSDGPNPPPEWLLRDRVYSDFILHVEWRFVPVQSEKRAYNAGVLVRAAEDASTWHQAQLGSQAGGYLHGVSTVQGKSQPFDLRREIQGRRVRAAGQWNTYEITCKSKHLMLWVNGAVVNEWSACEVPAGRLGFAARGYAVEFRRVSLKRLDPVMEPARKK